MPMWPPGGVQPPPADPTAVRQWHGLPVRGLVAGAVVFVFLALVIAAAVWPRTETEKPPDSRYLRIRATCEDRVTRQLDPIYQVGGRHWVDAVNRCMLDLASD